MHFALAGATTKETAKLSEAGGFELKTLQRTCDSRLHYYHVAWQPPRVAVTKGFTVPAPA